jgi:hypothetical protein
MRLTTSLAAAIVAAVAAAATPAAAGAWPLYHYYGYDPAWGYYGSPSAGPSSYYVPPRAGYGGYAGPVCAWRLVRVAGRPRWACF